MERLTIPLPGREYDILIERGLLARVGGECRRVLPKAERCLIVTDDTVAPLYADIVEKDLCAAGFEVKTLVLPAGEGSKNLAMLGRIYDALTSLGVTRTDCLVALGGGVIGDLAGFAAATILRGIAYVQLPTTLLSQVDSSVGGKVAIDLPAGKNLAGAFWQPSLVLIDPDCLKTLSDRAFATGMAEVIKYGCIRDRALFGLFAAHAGRAAIEPELEFVIRRCCALKCAVVLEDERDTGARRELNFGHTLGHAIELAGDYEQYTHGEAVAIGMCLAARLGEQLGYTPKGTETHIASLLRTFGLPTTAKCGRESFEKALRLDKKSRGSKIGFVFLSELGTAQVVTLAQEELIALAAPLSAD